MVLLSAPQFEKGEAIVEAGGTGEKTQGSWGFARRIERGPNVMTT